MVSNLVWSGRETEVRREVCSDDIRVGISTYAPHWVKTDTKRFPRARLRKAGGELAIGDVLSIFHSEAQKADAKAFGRFMAHLKEVDEKLDHWQGDMTSPERRELIEEEQWLAAQLELIGDAPPPTVREDTRFLIDHAETPTEAEMVEGQQADESLTHHRDEN